MQTSSISESDYFDKNRANAHKTGNFGTGSQRLLTNDSYHDQQQTEEEDFP